MTDAVVMAQMERLIHAGYRAPEELAGVFEEWRGALMGRESEALEAGVTRLIRTRTSSFWPTVADVLESMRAVSAGSTSEPRGCTTCHGTTWIDAPPYRANGGHLYEGVMRCPACGVPAPRLDGPNRQTPLTASEYREWAQAQRPVEELTQAEFRARLAVLGRAKVMPFAGVR